MRSSTFLCEQNSNGKKRPRSAQRTHGRRGSYSSDFHGTTYVITGTVNRKALYRIPKNGKPKVIASSDEKSVSSELVGLFRHSARSNDEWVMKASTAFFRQCFGDVVSIRDLFRMIDHPERLAEDAADEKTYLAVNAGKLQSETEILDFHRRSRREALRAIRSIIGCKKETDSILPIDDHDSNPLNWRVKIPDDFPAGKTDLHVRICPTYHSEEADGDMNREYAVKFAALVILLSL